MSCLGLDAEGFFCCPIVKKTGKFSLADRRHFEGVHLDLRQGSNLVQRDSSVDWAVKKTQLSIYRLLPHRQKELEFSLARTVTSSGVLTWISFKVRTCGRKKMARLRHYEDQRHHRHTVVMLGTPVKTYYVVHAPRHRTWQQQQQLRQQQQQQQQQQQEKRGKAKAGGFVLGEKQKVALRGFASLLSTCMASPDSCEGKQAPRDTVVFTVHGSIGVH